MIVRGPRPETRFYTLDKAISEDSRLSWAARGLLVYLLGKPDHWSVSPAALVAETVGAGQRRTGRDGVYALLGELSAAGYVSRRQERLGDGSLWQTSYIVRERPLPAEPFPAEPFPAEPFPAEPFPANPTQASTVVIASTDVIASTEVRQAKASRRDGVAFNAATGRLEGITGEQMADWVGRFPGLNVGAEIARAEVWLIAHPKRRKSLYLRFLLSWLSRAWADAHLGRGVAARSPTSMRDEHRASFAAAIRNAAKGGGDVIDIHPTA